MQKGHSQDEFFFSILVFQFDIHPLIARVAFRSSALLPARTCRKKQKKLQSSRVTSECYNAG
ncbi:unnamed protein product, partial [Nesidiocoris tenuis]